MATNDRTVNGRAYVVLSFFKERKLDYLYQPELERISFICFTCTETCEIDVESTKWRCEECKQGGNLINLLEAYNKRSDAFKKRQRVYNPSREYKAIVNSFKKLKTNSESKDIQRLEERVLKLIDHYKKNKEV